MKNLAFSFLLAAIAPHLFTGCPAPVPGLVTFSLEHDGQKRTYEFYEPECCIGTKPAPLVVALHRFTETGAAMARTTQFNALADVEKFFVAYPNGLRRSFNYRDLPEPDDFGFVLAVVQDLLVRHNIDPERVYLVGASNGGFLTYRLLCEAPDLFAGGAVVMAAMPEWITEACTPSAVPILIMHGTEDRVVPYDSDTIEGPPGVTTPVLPIPATVAYWVAANEAAAAPTITPIPDLDPADGCTAEIQRHESMGAAVAPVVHVRIEGGGHTWPGSETRTVGFLEGPRCNDFAATEVIWDFFSEGEL
jgi:polyhydroxybutyrate depolymerase